MEAALAFKNQVLTKIYNRRAITVEEVMAELLQYAQRLAPLVSATSEVLEHALDAGKNVLLEAGQATLLDVDHGTYPYVTSSSATAGGACTGSGIPPMRVTRVIAILKAYTTRVGEGPFPTELFDDDGEFLRKVGAESVPICIAYDVEGVRHDEMPVNQSDFHHAKPIYEELPGWWEDISGCRTFADLPANAQAYVLRVEELIGARVSAIGVGPGRDEIISRFPLL